VGEVAEQVGIQAACNALGVSRATLYRHQEPPEQPVAHVSAPSERTSPVALSVQEQQRVLQILQSERFMDASPRQVWAKLLDEGEYLCSVRTMYRLLQREEQVRERRNQLRHPAYKKPELLATRPNQVWSWDITKLRGVLKGCYYYLYVILDIYSRYVVGWLLAEKECQTLAEHLIRETCQKQGIQAEQLTIHADRGAPMTSKSVALLLVDLGVEQSHSRPHVSDDNPYSESQFKTMKYCPHFPDRFGSLPDARSFCSRFFGWYNGEHHHTGIALLTPEMVHYGRAEAVLEARKQTLEQAYAAHPQRFHRRPEPPALPEAVWINAPKSEPDDPQASRDASAH
jgi:putative transposase